MNDVRLPLALSLAGHAAFLAVLVLLAVAPPPRPAMPSLRGIELVLAPPQPKAPPAPPAPAARPAPPQPPAVWPPPKLAPPPRPAPRPVAKPPPARVPAPIVTEPPRPRHKPLIRRMERPLPRRVPHRVRREPIRPRYAPPPIPEPAVPRYVPPAPIPEPSIPRYAPPRPPAAAAISPGYRASLIGWIEAHKRYPEAARERDEEGAVVLRFRVDRSGSVLDCTVVRSSGYVELDEAATAMMRGAVLPPFPPSMPQQSLTISVTIRFGLR